MVSNGDKYKPMAVFPSDHEKFISLCKELGVGHVDGFTLCVEAWQNVIRQGND